MALAATAAAAAHAVERGGAPESLLVFVVLLVGAGACVNRQALFTAEISVSAEASIVLCAVVLFRDEAPVLAPMVIGLAAGWLDSFHWSSRAWAPMAFNSGMRAIEALLSAFAFSVVSAAMGGGLVAVAGAAVAAAVAFELADLALITALVVSRDGRTIGGAAREVWRIDAVSFPLALLGGAAGLLGVATMPWVGAVAVLPTAMVPDLLLAARAYGSWRRLGAVGAVAASFVALSVVVGLVAGFPSAPVTAALVMLGLLAGVELVADGRLPTTPALGAVVLLAVAAVHPDDAVTATVIVAAVASSVSWSFGTAVRPVTFATATGSTLAIVAVCGLVVAAGGPTLLAAGAFLLGVVLVAPRGRTVAAVVWSFPFVALGASAGHLHAWVSAFVTVVYGAALLVACAVVVAWTGPPPWRSRLATRWSRSQLLVSHRGLWCALAALAAAAAAGATVTSPPTRPAAIVGLALVVEVAASVALTRVRLWRFVRSRRVVETALLDLAAAGAWSAAALAGRDDAWAFAVATGAAAVVFATGTATIAVAERAESSRRRRHDRTDVEVAP